MVVVVVVVVVVVDGPARVSRGSGSLGTASMSSSSRQTIH